MLILPMQKDEKLTEERSVEENGERERESEKEWRINVYCIKQITF